MKKYCSLCGAEAKYGEEFKHRLDCPNHPDAIDDTPVEPIVKLDNHSRPVASIGAARFDRATHPEEVSPRDALTAALDWVDGLHDDDPATHIIVLIGRDTPEKQTASGTKFFQAGTYRHHAQMGLCLEAMHLIRESG
jgi:hypothetical protein